MTKNLLNKIIIFSAGAICGSLVTWRVIEMKKRNETYDYDYDDVYESGNDDHNELEDSKPKWYEDDDTDEPVCDYVDDPDYNEELLYDPTRDEYVHIKNNIRRVIDEDEYYKILDELQRRDEESEQAYRDVIKELGYDDNNREVEEDMKEPYVIPPEEFGECGYAIVSLTMYTDGLVANEKNKLIRNVDELIGEDSLTHFGEYEEDSVFVRNDRRKIDYEILKDYRTYEESKY